MKGMQKIKRGNNFRGVLDYAFDRDKNEEKAEGVLVGGNMAGTNAKELTAEFLRFADARKDIQKPVWHNSLRLPEGDTLTDDEWNKVGTDYMQRLGFDPNLNQYVFIKHDDKEGQHIHIVGSRIDMLGNVWLGRNENLISTRIISELEIEHNLTQTKNLDYTKDDQGNYAIAERTPGRGRTLSRVEQLMQDHKQWTDADYLAPKQRLANAVTETLDNQPTTEQFINALESENIQVQCVVKKGQMVGFSFAIDGENFKGSQVGANWKDITNERKLNYEQERDAEIIASRRYGTSSKQSTGVQSTPGADAETVKRTRKQRAVADTGNLERDSRGRFIPSSQPENDARGHSSTGYEPDLLSTGNTDDIGKPTPIVQRPTETKTTVINVGDSRTTDNQSRGVGMAALQLNHAARRPEKQPSDYLQQDISDRYPAEGNKAVINVLFDDVDEGAQVVKTLDTLAMVPNEVIAKAKAVGVTLSEAATTSDADTKELVDVATGAVKETFEPSPSPKISTPNYEKQLGLLVEAHRNKNKIKDDPVNDR